MSASLSDDQLLARLVAFDYISTRSNLPIADFLCDYLDGPGVRIVRRPNPDGSKVNVVAVVGPQSVETTRDGLVLSGHLDVVPANEPEWQSDPFTLTERDGAYVARGACDMKGFVTLAVNLARRMRQEALTHPLVLILTYDEECGTLGARHLVETWEHAIPLPLHAIVGEPTSLQAVRLHKGHVTMRILFRGLPAHTAYAHLGRNAIEPAARVILALGAVQERLRSLRSPASEFYPDSPGPTLNVGRIHGGDAVNVVPDLCELSFGVRILPGMDVAAILDSIRESVQALPNLGDYTMEVIARSPPLLLDESATIYRDVCNVIDQQKTAAVSYATDAGELQALGLQCVIFGPGDIAVAHKPNEWLSMAEFQRARQLLEQLIRIRCFGP